MKFEDIIDIAERENNNIRNYLYVNKLQGKHFPASPKDTLSLFQDLAELVEKTEEKTIVIGFAETATAIGALVSSCIGGNYIHTTREFREKYNILSFQEEHSHAKEQRLYCDEIHLSQADRIIFVEDEITTGKTILNLVRELRENKYINKRQKIQVLSIVNGMSRENIIRFEELNIKCYSLIKIENDKSMMEFPNEELNKSKGFYIRNEPIIKTYNIEGCIDPRIGTDIDPYYKAVNKLIEYALEGMNISKDEKILVLGTEEFMYPSIRLGHEIERIYEANVRSHATTRSPIIPRNRKDYPIKERFEVKSFYEDTRRTFIYNLDYYDKVFVISDTDSIENWQRGFDSLVEILKEFGCKEIYGIRWIRL